MSLVDAGNKMPDAQKMLTIAKEFEQLPVGALGQVTYGFGRTAENRDSKIRCRSESPLPDALIRIELQERSIWSCEKRGAGRDPIPGEPVKNAQPFGRGDTHSEKGRMLLRLCHFRCRSSNRWLNFSGSRRNGTRNRRGRAGFLDASDQLLRVQGFRKLCDAQKCRDHLRLCDEKSLQGFHRTPLIPGLEFLQRHSQGLSKLWQHLAGRMPLSALNIAQVGETPEADRLGESALRQTGGFAKTTDVLPQSQAHSKHPTLRVPCESREFTLGSPAVSGDLLWGW